MDDQKNATQHKAIGEITPELKTTLNETRAKLKGSDRRRFMAQIVLALGPGGQSRAQRELGWNRNVIIKGLKELKSNIRCIDNYSGRGRKPAEHHLPHLPHLLENIKAIVEPVSQIDPTFRTDQNYCPLTAGEVRRRLKGVPESKQSDDDMQNKIRYHIKRDYSIDFVFFKAYRNKYIVDTAFCSGCESTAITYDIDFDFDILSELSKFTGKSESLL